MGRLADIVNHAIGLWLRWNGLLVLPIIGLLFLQWPLRELIQFGSREANDVGQCLFALYIAGSMTAASRANQHLRSEGLVGNFSARVRRAIRMIGLLCGALPWAVYVLLTSIPVMARSVLQWEHFADTGNPGYFAIKIALVLMAALMALQAVVDLFAPQTLERDVSLCSPQDRPMP